MLGEARFETEKDALALVARQLQAVISQHEAALPGVCGVETAAAFGSGSTTAPHHARILQGPVPPAMEGAAESASAVHPMDCTVSSIVLNPPERVAPYNLVTLADKDEQLQAVISSMVNKTLMVVATLCDETQELQQIANEKLIPALILFGPPNTNNAGSGDHPNSTAGAQGNNKTDGSDLLMDENLKKKKERDLVDAVGRFVVTLQKCYNFTLRCQKLIRNIVCQIVACFYYFSAVDMVPLAQALATLLRSLITMDAAITSNSELRRAWDMYRALFKRHSQEQLLLEEPREAKKRETMGRMLVQLDFTLMSSRSFVMAIEQNFQSVMPVSEESGVIVDEIFCSLLTTLYSRYSSKINTENESTERLDVVGVYGMYALYRRLLPSHVEPHVKLHKSLWTVLPNMCPVIGLTGSLAFIPTDFIATYCAPNTHTPHTVQSRLYEAAALVKKWDKSFDTRVSKLQTEVRHWLALADSDLSPSPPTSTAHPPDVTTREQQQQDPIASSVSEEEHPISDVEDKATLILRGLTLANCCSITLQSYLLTHKTLEVRVTNSHVASLMSLCETLKAIEKVLLVRRRSAVTAIHRAALKMVASSIFRRFDSLRSVVDQHMGVHYKSDEVTKRDVLRISTSLSALESLLKGSSTYSPLRRYAIAAAICLIGAESVLSDSLSSNDIVSSDNLLQHLGVLADIDKHIQRACDCSFLVFHRELLSNCVKLKKNGTGMQLLLSAFSDPTRSLLRCTPHLPAGGSHPFPLLEAYREFVIDQVLQETVIDPLCRDVETHLRLAVHHKNFDHMQAMNPKKDSMKQFRQLLNSPSLHVCGTSVDIKGKVEQYLNKTFYNLTAAALPDAQTYNEMKILAKERFGLVLAQSYLPVGSLEQGIDVLNIMSDIHDFASKYSYNLTEQTFIEKRPDKGAKYLNTISVQSIAASLRQHGSGVVATAANNSCNYLVKRVKALKELLADDYVRSLLSKEARWSNDAGRRNDSCMYSTERAFGFTKEFRRLEGGGKSHYFLDQCREIVTEIGNALGFVRMVRSAALRYTSEAMEFLPHSVLYKTDENPRTSDLWDQSVHNADDGGRSAAAVQRAVQNVDEAMSSLASTVEERSDYLRVFLGLFQDTIAGEIDQHGHLENFYAMVPALTLCWMDASIQAKEAIKKSSLLHNQETYYISDGFALGIAFLLASLKQNDAFDRLGWFRTLQNKYTVEAENLLTKTMGAPAAGEKPAESGIFGSSMFSFGARLGNDSTKESNTDNDSDVGLAPSLKVTGKRLKEQKREVELLFFAFHGSRIFFKDNT